MTGGPPPLGHGFAALAVERLAPAPGVRALDLGCRRGATEALRERGAVVTTVDAADVAAVQALPSAAFALTVSELAPAVADPATITREAVRVTAPGGRVAFIVPAPDPPDDPLRKLYAEYRPNCAGRHGDFDPARLGLPGPTAEPLEIAVPVPDGETYWNWSRAYESGHFIDELTPYRRAELHARVLEHLVELPGHILRRAATLWTAHAG